MPGNLNLVKTDTKTDQRKFPRFPLNSLTLRFDSGGRAMEVVNISCSGLQAVVKEGLDGLGAGEQFSGELHRKGEKAKIQGVITWIEGNSIGVKFDQCSGRKVIETWLIPENLVQNLKAIHQGPLSEELPQGLKVWLRSDGPFEFFLWQHTDGELSKMQMILGPDYIEWLDGEGVQTGVVVRQWDHDNQGHESSFEATREVSWSHEVNDGLLGKAREALEFIPISLLSGQAQDFLLRKLGR